MISCQSIVRDERIQSNSCSSNQFHMHRYLVWATVRSRRNVDVASGIRAVRLIQLPGAYRHTIDKKTIGKTLKSTIKFHHVNHFSVVSICIQKYVRMCQVSKWIPSPSRSTNHQYVSIWNISTSQASNKSRTVLAHRRAEAAKTKFRAEALWFRAYFAWWEMVHFTCRQLEILPPLISIDSDSVSCTLPQADPYDIRWYELP